MEADRLNRWTTVKDVSTVCLGYDSSGTARHQPFPSIFLGNTKGSIINDLGGGGGVGGKMKICEGGFARFSILPPLKISNGASLEGNNQSAIRN